jgi:hypothetical protein
MIDTAKAKHLRDQAARLARREGRATGIVETEGRQRRIVQYESGRLNIEYISPRYPNEPAVKTVRPSAYAILVRFDGSKVLSVAWDDTRTAVLLMKPGRWERLIDV